MADRINGALPPAIMAKDIPLAGIMDPDHERYSPMGQANDMLMVTATGTAVKIRPIS